MLLAASVRMQIIMLEYARDSLDEFTVALAEAAEERNSGDGREAGGPPMSRQAEPGEERDMADDHKTRTDGQEAAENELLDHAAETAHEMRDAMSTMMEASTKMMQAFVDLRLSYLKMIRSGLDHPQAAFEMMAKNAREMADAVKRDIRNRD